MTSVKLINHSSSTADWNYYLNNHGKCAYSEDDRYCVLVKWADFKASPNNFIEQAFNKRSQPIADDVVVYPK